MWLVIEGVEAWWVWVIGGVSELGVVSVVAAIGVVVVASVGVDTASWAWEVATSHVVATIGIWEVSECDVGVVEAGGTVGRACLQVWWLSRSSASSSDLRWVGSSLLIQAFVAVSCDVAWDPTEEASDFS